MEIRKIDANCDECDSEYNVIRIKIKNAEEVDLCEDCRTELIVKMSQFDEFTDGPYPEPTPDMQSEIARLDARCDDLNIKYGMVSDYADSDDKRLKSLEKWKADVDNAFLKVVAKPPL